MSPDQESFEVHPGLRLRFVAAGEQIAWRPLPEQPTRPAERRGRIALLREDEARFEEWGSDDRGGVMVDSSPLGALLMMLAIDRRGVPTALGAVHAGRDDAFPSGALVAVWGDGSAPEDEHPRFTDVLRLARYALE
ncbi:MAG: hypothetical protein L3K02_05270 [Thermoplasmata archaeon]|nr:hypothetical protein [Thermoplasmata archaeon]